MELIIASVCKTKDQHLKAAEQDYCKRFPRHLPVRIVELGGEKYLKHSKGEQQTHHGKLLEKIALPTPAIVLLDEGGTQFSTEKFSSFIQEQLDNGTDRLAFALGGPSGWSEETKKASKMVLSLSKLTMPYQLARLVLIEQLYRCFTIQSNIPYHR